MLLFTVAVKLLFIVAMLLFTVVMLLFTVAMLLFTVAVKLLFTVAMLLFTVAEELLLAVVRGENNSPPETFLCFQFCPAAPWHHPGKLDTPSTYVPSIDPWSQHPPNWLV